MTKHILQTPWEFTQIWNDSLLSFDKRDLKKRSYCYASEIGGSFCDRFLKMQAKPFTNPPNDRSMRKFSAGNIWEWIIGFVLTRAGIRQDRQTSIKHQLPGCLLVSGRLDYVAGGQPNWDVARMEIKKLDLPDIIYYASDKIIEQLAAKYTDNFLEENVLEVKSVSSFVFDKIDFTHKPLPHHAAQNFFYCFGSNMPGKLVYVCRDDCRLAEFRISQHDRNHLAVYQDDLTKMTDYWNAKKRPPREEELLFDEGTFRFRANWRVEYSPYLTMLYGYKNPDEFRKRYLSTSAQYNRVFKRCVDCATMTKPNLEIIKEAKKKFKQWDEWVVNARIAVAKGLLQNVEDEIIDA